MRLFLPARPALVLELLVATCLFAQVHSAPGLPTLQLTQPHVVITQSCSVFIPPGRVFADTNGVGAIEIGASHIEVEFQKGCVLRGSLPGSAPDGYNGYGIVLKGREGVVLRGLKVSGYRCAIWAVDCDRLVLDGIDASDNYHARLRSSPMAEDESDWLYGHDNDGHEWLTRYGAAIYLEKSAGVTVRNCQVSHGQNALCLDRVERSQIFDNDFSFNSGWGVALWRSCSNIISRNALDFCIRGYSHGFYNRGQDSAGIFAFEQNNGNVFAENSVTHGGDGFFGFAGREALGQSGEHELEWYRGRGNSDNLLIRNDFSYAAAHGIENTFSFGNRYLRNRIFDNAICGIWAGYSRRTVIAGNEIRANGSLGYGLERGGVDVDHGGDNFILANFFSNNKCGVHLWGGAVPDFAKLPWARANGYESTGSIISDNEFDSDQLALQFRGPGQVFIGTNRFVGVPTNMLHEAGYQVFQGAVIPPGLAQVPDLQIPGSHHPVGAHPELQGREAIVMTEWGPWDHLTPFARFFGPNGATNIYEVFQVPAQDIAFQLDGSGLEARLDSGDASKTPRILLTAGSLGVHPFHLQIEQRHHSLADFSGTLLRAAWQATFFKWPAQLDPRTNLVAYQALAQGPGAVTVVLDQLSLKYGMRGPGEMGLPGAVAAAHLGRDHFGMIARTRLQLPAGKWLFATDSDDGVRVSVDGQPLIQNWSWHGPTHDTGLLELKTARLVEIVVEHFQIDGYAILDFSLVPAGL